MATRMGSVRRGGADTVDVVASSPERATRPPGTASVVVLGADRREYEFWTRISTFDPSLADPLMGTRSRRRHAAAEMKDVLHLLSDPVVQIGAAIAAIKTAYAIPRGLHLFWAACADLLNDMRRHNVLGLDRRTGERRSHWPERRRASYRSRFADVKGSC